MQKEENWFTSWFDTPYYHILYKNRDDNEAQFFMSHLTNYLNLPDHAKILDLACGKGRHAIYLNSLGYHVIGADLSENSIEFAKKFENDSLFFKVHDMSKPFQEEFDAVFNLFTSFGYFEDEDDNLNTIKAIKENLNENGFAVIDFMNVQQVINNLVPEETKLIDDITFNIKRYVEDGYILKDISFSDKGAKHVYTEKVKALSLEDFQKYFKIANIDLLDIFGDYKLGKYNKENSERLIMIFK